MILRFSVSVGLFFLFLFSGLLFLTSKSHTLDNLASHYVSYHSAYPVRLQGFHFSSARSISFDYIQVGESEDSWQLSLSSGRIIAARLGDIIFQPRRLYFYSDTLQLPGHPELRQIRGYLIARKSGLRVHLRNLEFENTYFKGGALFVDGKLSKGDLLIKGSKKIANFLGPLSRYVEALKTSGNQPLKATLIYLDHQIILRGSRKPIASFSWSAG